MENPVQEGKPGPGRPKGSQNKLSKVAKENIESVFEALGGVDKMTLWAADNPSEFYRIYSKLIVVKVEGSGPDGEHVLISRVERAIVRPKD